MNSKIDWRNHFISFLSALIGILIAFQLEDYKNRKQETEELNITMTAIKSEIENNLKIYDRNIHVLSTWLELYNLVENKNKKGMIMVSKEKFATMMTDSLAKNRTGRWKVEHLKDSILLTIPDNRMLIDVLPEEGVSMSSWKAALSSGVINHLENQRLSQLTKIYEWTERDLGLDELAIYQNNLNNTSEYDNVTDLIPIFKKTVRIQSAKYSKIHKIYTEINW